MYRPIYDQGYGEPKKSCLQKYVALTSYFNLIVSLLALSFGIYRAVKNNNVWTNQFDWNVSLIAGIVVLSSLLFLCSLAGIIGSRKRNKCCIFFFQTFSLLLAITFGVIGFVFLAFTNNNIAGISDAKCNSNDNTSVYEYSQEAYDQAALIFCVPGQCACNITNEDVLKAFVGFAPYVSTTGVTKVQNCPNYSTLLQSNARSQVGWLQSLEETFSCTGMCRKDQNIYYFSDINNGVPDSDTCKQAFEDFVDSYGKLIYLIGLGVSLYLLINSVISCFLCCKKKNTGETYYERFGQF